nr:transposase [Candidatus Enterovibrio escacola]
MALIVKSICKLPLRELEGFLNSVFTLINIPLKLPTYTCIINHWETVKIKYPLQVNELFPTSLLMP